MLAFQDREFGPMACLKVQSGLVRFLEGADARLSLRQEHVRNTEGQRIPEDGLTFLSKAMRDARAILWQADIYQASLAGSQSFAQQALAEAMVPLRPLLFFHPSLYYSPVGTHVPPDMRGFAELLVPVWSEEEQRAVLIVALFYSFGINTEGRPAGPIADPYDLLPWVVTMPMLEEGELIGGASGLIAQCVFLGLPFVTQREEKPGQPAERRRQQRKYGFVPEVRVVCLRRSGETERSPDEGATSRKYHCSWLVSGHWRSRAERWGPGEPIYVQPHLKGPADQPFRSPRPVLYRARR